MHAVALMNSVCYHYSYMYVHFVRCINYVRMYLLTYLLIYELWWRGWWWWCLYAQWQQLTVLPVTYNAVKCAYIRMIDHERQPNCVDFNWTILSRKYTAYSKHAVSCFIIFTKRIFPVKPPQIWRTDVKAVSTVYRLVSGRRACPRGVTKLSLIMAALWNTAGHYIFVQCFLLLSYFFLSFSSPILSGRRLDVCHISTHDVALVRI